MSGLSFIVGMKVPDVLYVVDQWRREHPGEEIPDGHVFVQPWPAGPNKMVPLATIVVRSELLRTLTGAPVQHGAFLLFALALAAAAGLGLAVLLLQLALGATDREATLARLATMGLGEGQRARLVLLEVLPAVIAAAVASVAAALALPPIVAPAINLSVFTGSSADVPLVPDAASFALPIAGLIVMTAVTLTIEIRARRSVVAALRGGE